MSESVCLSARQFPTNPIIVVLFEDHTVNRMHESLALFAEVAKNPIFKNTPIFVFLNKKDLFEEMIPKVPLTVCFPEYKGTPGDVREAISFIEGKYRAIMNELVPGKQVYIHVIAARLRQDMKIAFGEVRDQLKKLFPVKEKRNSATHLASGSNSPVKTK